MKQYEYKLVDFNQLSDMRNIEDFLNEHGKEGWQVVDFQSMGSIKAFILMKESGCGKRVYKIHTW